MGRWVGPQARKISYALSEFPRYRFHDRLCRLTGVEVLLSQLPSVGRPARASLPAKVQLQIATRKIRVMVVDDEPLVCGAVALLLDREPHLEVCCQAQSEPHALERLRAAKPDLAVVDLALKEGHGLRLIKRLRRRRPRLKVLVMSMFGRADYVTNAFAAGVHGYITKDEAAEKLLEAIDSVMKGQFYLSKEMATRMPNVLPALWEVAG